VGGGGTRDFIKSDEYTREEGLRVVPGRGGGRAGAGAGGARSEGGLSSPSDIRAAQFESSCVSNRLIEGGWGGEGGGGEVRGALTDD
jgi:hypothetical protein